MTTLSETISLLQAGAVIDHASIVTRAFQQARDKATDEAWDTLTDGPLGELLMALTDLEYEVDGE